jgi:O-acetyl-ADP-ribose deacetylase (regulator of RNase III)
MVQIVKGDLIKLAVAGEFDVILHGCNCFSTWGAGIAKQMKRVFPEAYKVDMKTEYGDKSKLGTYTLFKYPMGFTVVNCYTQYHYSSRSVVVDYSAVERVLKRISEDFVGKKIGLPKIGAGLAGGDWNTILKLIEKYLPNAVVIEYDGGF